MPVTRQRQFPELVQIRGQQNCLVDLGLNSVISDVSSISGMNVSQANQIASISGNNISQSSQIASISANYAPTSYVNLVSSNMETDFFNLDYQVAQLQTNALQINSFSTVKPSAAPMSATMWASVAISGSNYWMPLYA